MDRLRLLAAASLALNLAGITWGLPARWHPDEKADVVAAMAAEGRLVPDSFINPSLPLYLSFPLIGVQVLAARAGTLGGTLADPLLAGRALSALAGAFAVLLFGRLLRRVDPGLGPWPVAALAVAPGVVNLCHFATPEPWLILGTVVVLAAAARHLEGRGSAWTLGLAVGLTASTKYTAAALLAPALAAVWLRPPATDDARGPKLWLAVGLAALGVGLAASGIDVALASRLHLRDARLLHPDQALSFVRWATALALAGGAASIAVGGLALAGRGWARRLAITDAIRLGLASLGGFLLGTPFAALRPLAFLSDLAFNHQTRHEYKGLVGGSTSFGMYLEHLGDAMTWPVLAASLLGVLVALGRALRRDRLRAVVLLAGVAPFLLVASSGHHALRFLAPAFPAAAWLAGLGLSALPSPRLRPWVSGAVLARAAVGALLVVRLFYVDSRRLAEQWIECHVPPGDAVDVITNHVGYAPRVPEDRPLRVVPTLSREMAPPDRFVEAAAAYHEQAAPWLILTESYYRRFLDHPDQRPERAAFFRDLLEGRGGFEVVARFRQRAWLRPEVEFVDPEIVILKKR
jgi:hypothetical protein